MCVSVKRSLGWKPSSWQMYACMFSRVCVHLCGEKTLCENIIVCMHGMISRMCVPRIGLYVSMCIHLTRTYVCMYP